MMNETKKLLGKLLANENITVTQANVSTAMFDTKKRVLLIPFWKEMDNEMYNMLLGHEVGHALYTPADHHLKFDIKGIPHAYLNVVEDARIERLILAKYPGLAFDFKKAYSQLIANDFFGINGKDVSKLALIDRINIHAKTRGEISVPFFGAEVDILERVNSAKTFQEVVDICRDIMALPQAQVPEDAEDKSDKTDEDEKSEQKQSEQGNSQDESQENNQGQSGAGDGSDGDNEQEASGSAEGNGEDGEESEGQQSSSGSGDGEGEESDESKTQTSSESSTDQEGQSGDGENIGNGASRDGGSQNQGTDSLYEEGSTVRDVAEASAEYTQSGKFVKTPTLKSIRSQVIDLKTLRGHRGINQNSSLYEAGKEKLTKLLKKEKSAISTMVTEFERKKAAYRYARAKTSQKGSIDLKKLHQYKTNDNIFKQVTTLANGKNHGVFVMLDFSGSMASMIRPAIEQLIKLAVFCRRVGIKFVAYGFTSGNAYGTTPNFDQIAAENNEYDVVSLRGVRYFEMLNTELSKSEWDTSLIELCGIHFGGRTQRFMMERDLGGTPLTEAYLITDALIDDFKVKHRIDKMTFVSITDGHGSSISVANPTTHGYQSPTLLLAGNKLGTRDVDSQVIKHIRSKGTYTMSFFLTPGLRRRNRLGHAIEKKNTKTEKHFNTMTWMAGFAGFDEYFYVDVASKEFKGRAQKLALNEKTKDVDGAFADFAASQRETKMFSRMVADAIA